MNTIRHPGDAEAAAAIAGLHEQTVTPRRWQPGDVVRCPKAFGNGEQIGTVHAPEQDRRVGTIYLVDTPEGRLRLLPDELELV